MPPSAAVSIAGLLLAYVLIGFVFAIPFVTVGATRLDPSARNTSWVLRVFLIPGSALLWPWLLLRWLRIRRSRQRSSGYPGEEERP